MYGYGGVPVVIFAMQYTVVCMLSLFSTYIDINKISIGINESDFKQSG